MAVSTQLRWGFLLSLLGGGATYAVMSDGDWEFFAGAVAVACGGLRFNIGAISGYRNRQGRERSFSLRLEAPRALCFVQIERKTAQTLDGG